MSRRRRGVRIHQILYDLEDACMRLQRLGKSEREAFRIAAALVFADSGLCTSNEQVWEMADSIVKGWDDDHASKG